MPYDPADRSLTDFIAEAEELLESLEQDILTLGEGAAVGELSGEVLNRIFRAAHTLKGVSGMYGFERMTRLSHLMEEAFDSLRMDRLAYSPSLRNALLETCQVLREVIRQRAEDAADLQAGFERCQAALDACVHAPAAAAPAPPPAAAPPAAPARAGGGEDVVIDPEILKVLTEYEEHVLRKNIKSGRALYKVHCGFSLDTFDKGLEKVTEQLKGVSEVISVLPSTSSGDESALEFDILIATDREPDTLLDNVEPGCRLDEFLVKRPPKTPPPPAAPAAKGGPPAPVEDSVEARTQASTIRSASETVRVDIKKLDNLMNIVGEMILFKTMLNQAGGELAARLGAKAIPPSFMKANKELERRLKDLQNRMMEVRLVPLSQGFSRLQREIRKLRDQLGKQIEVRLEGEDTQLDKLLVEELVDPLMHLVRNAVDHGIRTIGTVLLKASQVGNHVAVEVTDDGVGIDPARVLATAVGRKLPYAEEMKGELDRQLEALEPGQAREDVRTRFLRERKQDIFGFLFQPGFSTKTEVTTVSGRGVGLDVVKTKIAGLSGHVDVRSEIGKGTTFLITLPITLAIIQVLLVQVGEQQFAIPLASVLETRELGRRDISTIEQREVMQLRDRTLPLVRVRRFFGLNSTRPERQFVVVVGYGEKKMGLVVDELVGQQDVVIKSLGRLLRGVRGFAGAADLGSRTILVLDVGHIISSAHRM
ncbi:MAG: chemotaxis protein CheA [Nitrospirae bacterium]|nr:chemotaxis protein CheA [Nitrospirota bacterium]